MPSLTLLPNFSRYLASGIGSRSFALFLFPFFFHLSFPPLSSLLSFSPSVPPFLNKTIAKRSSVLPGCLLLIVSQSSFHFISLWLTRLSAYRSLNRLLDDAPFELRPAPGKGWGAFATRKLIPGQLIIEDKPLLVISKSHKHITESDVMSRFQRLQPRDKHRFLSLRDNGDREFTSMKKAFTENAFGVSNTHHAHGLFVFLSRFNHACVPNCKVPMAGTVIRTNRLHIYATRTVMPGEELTFCYNSIYDYMIAEDRTQRLGFQCDCKACLIGTPFQRASDMRRTLLRGLYFLKEGEDINWPRPVSMPPVLSDQQVRRAAEGFTPPLST